MAFVTRFAPSPTGPLHLGHAFSAIVAHDAARAAGGRFLLRMEDTDQDRARPEYEAQIIDDLRWLGLRWDGPVLRQSDRIATYAARLQPLIDRGLLYPCSCSRADIRAAAAAPQEGVAHAVYPGTCRGLDSKARAHKLGTGMPVQYRLDMERALALVGYEEEGDFAD